VAGAACQLEAEALELDEEEHVEAAERDRLDREEIEGEHGGRLLAQEKPPARPGASRRGPKTVGKQEAPDRAWGDTQAQLQQLAGDTRVAPAWVFPCEAQHELADAIIDGWPARPAGPWPPLAPPPPPTPT